MTRVLVTGATGQVGVDLTDTLMGGSPPGSDVTFQPDATTVDGDEFEVVGLGHRELDVTDRDAVRRTLDAVRPDVVVNLAAYTAVDRAESDPEACFAVNAGATESLSLVAHDIGAHFVTVSTDYVFDGMKGDAYLEDDAPNPLNVYGASKLASEMFCDEGDTVVRTSWVMGVRGKSVLHAIAHRALSGESVRFVDDQMGTVTVASDLARALVTVVRARPGGCLHVANTGATTWFDVARFAGAVLGRGEDFATPIATSDLDPPPAARRPPRSDLATVTWQSRGWSALPDWRDGVSRLLASRGRGVAS